MTTSPMVETTSDERVMAALAHFFGVIAALLVWATQKDKSRFVRFQALQALAFDALLIVVNLVLLMCAMIIGMAGALAAGFSLAQASNSPDSFLPMTMVTALFPMGMFLCIMPAALAALVIRIIAAVSVASGRDFRYPFIASRVDAFLREPAAGA